MIDLEKLKPVLEGYKAYFPVNCGEELYKWEAIKHFQAHWDIDAENFSEMFKRATEKTYNLLASGYAYPRAMIISFAEADGEAVRAMFRGLFDETRDLGERVDEFQSAAESIRAKYDDGNWKSHYQNTNAISTYLWLMYPDKYYIYKYELFRAAAKELSSDYLPKKNGSLESLVGGFQMYDEICDAVKKDPGIVNMIQGLLNPNCYPDPEFKTATIDIGFYLARYYIPERDTNRGTDEWYPVDYSPEINTETWVELLNDPSVFTKSSLKIMKRMKDYGGAATCTQLSIKYGETFNFYNTGSQNLAKRVAKKTGCPLITRDSGGSSWWPVLYLGKDADKSTSGVFIWKLREELAEALNMVDLSDVPLYDDITPSIWKISHGSISDSNRTVFEKRSVVVVHGTTRGKGVSKVSQGENFIHNIKKGDCFYLCYGNSIRLLGEFLTDDADLNPEMQDGWYERSYRVIAKSKDISAYKGIQKWWTPNDNSTCIKVEKDDQLLFESEILKPYFDYTLDMLFGTEEQSRGYWWLNASPKIWSFSSRKVGEEQSYSLYNENGNKRHIFQNFLNAKAGDMVIGYESHPVKKVVALAKVSQASDGENIYFEKLEGLTAPIDYQTLRDCAELSKMEFFIQPNGSLFKLTKGEYDFIMDLIREENPLQPAETSVEKYSKEDFLKKVYMTEARYDVLEALLLNKMNVILQGAPGVGKTFTAKKLAYAIMGETDDSRIEMVQFHQNYSYEDFIMGYRPEGSDFVLKEGIFYRFCQKASNQPDKKFFFIIDEINRGNLSKIFGELLMLIEKDYRGTEATMAYNGMPFSVPDNLYIIGMMNTADRSLAMIDYALRRRFSFFEIEPGFNSEGFRDYQKSFNNETFNALIDQIKILNKEITEDKALGPGFQIGHSYFCGREEKGCTEEWMRSVVEFDILPMLSEYWFDEPNKLSRWQKNLKGVFDDE